MSEGPATPAFELDRSRLEPTRFVDPLTRQERRDRITNHVATAFFVLSLPCFAIFGIVLATARATIGAFLGMVRGQAKEEARRGALEGFRLGIAIGVLLAIVLLGLGAINGVDYLRWIQGLLSR